MVYDKQAAPKFRQLIRGRFDHSKYSGLIILVHEMTSCRDHARSAGTMTVPRGVQGRAGS